MERHLFSKDSPGKGRKAVINTSTIAKGAIKLCLENMKNEQWNRQ
jgi:hypothetical protein